MMFPTMNSDHTAAPTAGTREDWFPTSVWYFDLSDADSLNDQLLAEIQGERARDPEGLSDRSSILGWHSQDDLHQREAFTPLTKQFNDCVAQVVAFQNWDLEQVTPRITNCWANENEKGSSNAVHNHPRAALSGVYYVQAPETCGDLFFRDPREAPAMVEPPMKRANIMDLSKSDLQTSSRTLIDIPKLVITRR